LSLIYANYPIASINDLGLLPKSGSPSQTSHKVTRHLPLQNPSQCTMSRVHKLCAALPKLDFEHSTIDPRLPPRQPEIFNPFPRLARELRNKIWQHAAFFPREVRLRTWDWNEHYQAIVIRDSIHTIHRRDSMDSREEFMSISRLTYLFILRFSVRLSNLLPIIMASPPMRGFTTTISERTS